MHEIVVHVTHLTETRSKFNSLRTRWNRKPRPLYDRIWDKGSIFK